MIFICRRPKRGDLLIFWSIKPDGRTQDPYSLHEGCPVVRLLVFASAYFIAGYCFVFFSRMLPHLSGS